MAGDPISLFEIVVYAAVGVGALVERYLSGRRGAATHWRRAVEACALTDVKWSSARIGRESSLTARAGELSITLEPRYKGRRLTTRILINGGEHATAGITMRPTARVTVSGAHVLGDEEFDRAVYVEGPHDVLTGALDAPTRRSIRGLLHGAMEQGGADDLDARVVIEDGRLQAEVVERTDRALETWLPRLLAALIEPARRLLLVEDVPGRLAENARSDPLAEFRQRSVAVLVRDYLDHPGTPDVLRAACADASPEVRLRAAGALEAEGQPTLLEIAGDDDLDEDVRARAVSALADPLPLERLQSLLSAAMRALQADLAAACVHALGRTGSPAAEGSLLQVLGHGRPELRVLAAKALGAVGTTEAVLPLREAAEGGAGALRRAAEEAVAAIQTRLPGATPGQVSMTEAEGGKVSLAETQDGRVSLPDRPSGGAT